MTLKERRETAGLTLKQVSKKLNVTETAVWNWENGKNAILQKYQKKLSKLYCCTVDDLLAEDDKEVVQ